jgi:RND superfamily putative drug exporter
MLALARALVRRRWIVIGLWAILGTYATTQAPRTPELLNVRGGTNRPTESSRANELISRRFAAPLGEYFAIALEAPGPVDQGPAAAVLDTLVAALQRTPGVRDVVTYREARDRPFLSADRRTTALILALDAATGDSSAKLVQPVRQTVAEVLHRVPMGSSYQVWVTGRSPLDLDARRLTAQETRRGEVQLLPLSLVILVLAFGALVAALLPLLIGFLTISISLTIVGLLTHVTPMSVFVLTIATMIGLGVGIDYSLLIVTRFREEMSRGYTRRDAAVNTILTAGGAVLWSGLTVVVGFGALTFTPLVETRSVGIGGLVVVAIAVLLSVTLLPALLAVMGREIDRPRWLARKLAWYHSPMLWEKWARSLSRHPWRALTLGLLCISILTLPVFWFRTGLPSRHWWPSATEAGAGIDVLNRLGAVGYVIPVRVLVEVPEGKNATDATVLRGLRALSDSLRADPRVRDVLSVVDLEPGTSILQYSFLYSDLDSARAQNPLVDTYLSADGRLALLDAFPSDTTSLTTSMELVARARALAANPPKQLKDAAIAVGGYSASNVDIQQDLLARFPVLVLLILGATGVMLAIAFRSVLIPIKAIILNTLSVAGTFGLIVLVFQKGFGSRIFGLDGPTDAIFVVIPVIVFAVVFGLSMDYEVFLLSRIKEAFDRTGRNDDATMEGVSATASVITSAALIMILVFGVFAFAKVLMMQFLGFGLAVAVLLDATVIRMVLVPAVMQLMGRWNWWPGVDPRKPMLPKAQVSGEHRID